MGKQSQEASDQIKNFGLAQMLPFKTGLVIKSSTKKELRLPETFGVQVVEDRFCTDPRKEFLYSTNDGISVYTSSPLNLVKKLDYKKEILDIIATDTALFLLNDSSLTLYSKTGFNTTSNNFKDSRLILVFSETSMIYPGVQTKKELQIYSLDLTRTHIFKCQCSFSCRDILLLGDINMLKVYVKNTKRFEVCMPDYITCILSDPLFAKIYCATQDNNIYVIDLSGRPMETLDYHEDPVRQMRLSLCGRFLYAADKRRVCVWDTRNEIVVGFADVEEGIDQIETILMDDRKYNESSLLI